jgi:hypothetical protein
LARLALLVALAAVIAAPTAHADGDPASDYLLGQQTFVPADTGVSFADKQRLNTLLIGAQRGGYTLRVALIASRYDLGAVTSLYKKPRLYAHFLSQELRFVYAKRLLVVMANGYGVARNGKPAPREQAVVDRLPPPASPRGHALATATERAVRALTAQAGVKIAAVPAGATGVPRDTTGRDSFLIAGAVVVVVLLAGGAVYLLPRRRRARG